MENVGENIKGMATVLFIIDLVAALIWFFYIIVTGSLFSSNNDFIPSLISLVPPACLILSSFVFYFLMYGFGQLVENSDIMVRHLSDEFEVIDQKRE